MSRRTNDQPRQSVLYRLAFLDLWRDRTISLCMVAAVIAVVAPLLLLFALKNGVVSQMRTDLAQQPSNLELRMLGHHRLDRGWIDAWRADPRVGFVIPMTRSLNTTADLRVSARAHLSNVELIPTTAGDPLLLGGEALRGDAQVMLSHTAAQRLQVRAGESLQLLITRQQAGQTERLNVPVTVQAVLTASVFPRDAALVSLPLLVALEDFRDGAVWPQPGELVMTDQALTREEYPRVRIYAKSLEDVAPLSSALQAQGYETVSRLADIEAMQAIDRLLGVVFGVIAWLAVSGGVACLVGAFMANIDRKRKDLALLRLFGYARRALMTYVVTQGMVIASSGFVLAVMLYGIGSVVFDAYLGQALSQGSYVSQLSWLHGTVALLLTVVVTLLISLLGGWTAMRITPSESLRDS